MSRGTSILPRALSSAFDWLHSCFIKSWSRFVHSDVITTQINDTHPPVLVVGAGPVGLVAALTLLQNGIPVRIIDKDPNPRMGQRGPGILPRSLELFNFLNVPDINELAKPDPPLRPYIPGTMEHMGDVPVYPHLEPTPAIPFIIPKLLGQQLLDVVLRRHLEKFSCTVEAGTELRSLEQSHDGVIAVLAKNETLETFHTKWVIGADGARGVVRKELGLKLLGETKSDVLVTGDICLTAAALDRDHSHLFGPFHTRILRPTDEVGEDGWQFVLIGRDLDTSKVAQSEEFIHETITSLVPTEISFKKLLWASEFRANIRMANKFSDRRVFIAGDAAHIHSPAGGQGLNSGVQDAFHLSWKVALVEKGLADKSLLETYNEERLPVISEMLEMTTSLHDQAVKGDVAVQGFPQLFMLGINCRFSSIVLDEFRTPVEGKPINAYGVFDEGHLEAGDRAPEAPALLHIQPAESGMTTLFSIYRPWYHTVLVFAPSPADAISTLAALESYNKSVVRSAVILPSSAPAAQVASPADLVLVDQEGHAYSAYLVEATQTKVFVIRPDGVIGAIVHGAEGVKKYFSKIFIDMKKAVEGAM